MGGIWVWYGSNMGVMSLMADIRKNAKLEVS